MTKKNRKRAVIYICVAVLFVAGIAGIRFYRNEAAKKKAAEQKKNQITGVSDLPGKRIGVQLGTTGDIYAADYEKDTAGTTVERFNKGADAVQALKVGKIDCVIIDEEPAKAYIEKNEELRILS